MQPGTVAGYPLPFKRQVPVIADRVLSTLDLNGLILVDSSAGPVTITLPRAILIRAGGFFQILALTGAAFPVTVKLQPGDDYNSGASADIILNDTAQSIIVLATQEDTRWLIPFVQGAQSANIRGNMAFTGNLGGVATIIPGAGTFVPIGNGLGAGHPSYVANPNNSLFSVQGGPDAENQVLRYDGTEMLCICARASVSAQDPALGAEGFAIQIIKNGVPQFPTSMEGQTGGLVTTAGNIYTETIIDISPGEVLQLLIANLTSPANLIFSSGLLSSGPA